MKNTKKKRTACRRKAKIEEVGKVRDNVKSIYIRGQNGIFKCMLVNMVNRVRMWLIPKLTPLQWSILSISLFFLFVDRKKS